MLVGHDVLAVVRLRILVVMHNLGGLFGGRNHVIGCRHNFSAFLVLLVLLFSEDAFAFFQNGDLMFSVFQICFLDLAAFVIDRNAEGLHHVFHVDAFLTGAVAVTCTRVHLFSSRRSRSRFVGWGGRPECVTLHLRTFCQFVT